MERKARTIVDMLTRRFEENLVRRLQRNFGLTFRSVKVNVKFVGQKTTVPRKFWPHRERLVPLSHQIPLALYRRAFKVKLPSRGRKLIEGFKNCANQPISGYGMRHSYDAWYNTLMTTNSALRKAGVPLQIVCVERGEYFTDNKYRLYTVEPPTERKVSN